jgi:hypothetical protein
MKKGSAIGIGVTVLAIAIIFGILSIPDEVLLENPSMEISDNPNIVEELPEEPATEELPEEPATEELPEEPATEELPEEPVAEETIEESEEESSEGETIKVEISDGVGSGDR